MTDLTNFHNFKDFSRCAQVQPHPQSQTNITIFSSVSYPTTESQALTIFTFSRLYSERVQQYIVVEKFQGNLKHKGHTVEVQPYFMFT